MKWRPVQCQLPNRVWDIEKPNRGLVLYALHLGKQSRDSHEDRYSPISGLYAQFNVTIVRYEEM